MRTLLTLLCTPLLFAAPQGDGASRADQRPFHPIVFGAGGRPYEAELFPGSDPDPAIPSPAAITGVRTGSRPVDHAGTLACWRAWAEASPRVSLESTGRTYEGRELVVGVVTSPRTTRGSTASWRTSRAWPTRAAWIRPQPIA